MSLSKIKKSELQHYTDYVVTTYKGWDVVVKGTAPSYRFSLSVTTSEDGSSDEGVYCEESGRCSTIAELKEEIQYEVEQLEFTAKEVIEWNKKLDGGARTYEQLEEAITAYEESIN